MNAYIVGTCHRLQCGSDKIEEDRVVAFRKEILRICSENKINTIFEEMSLDGLKFHGVTKTVCQGLSSDKCIEVRHLDLEEKERRCLSIDELKVEEYDSILYQLFNDLRNEIRERVWVARILEADKWPMLLICGSLHVSHVSRLLNRFCVSTEILYHDFEG